MKMKVRLTRRQKDELVEALYELSSPDLWATGMSALRMLRDRWKKAGDPGTDPFTRAIRELDAVVTGE